MPKRRPKDIGTAAETAVVRWLQANGWPHAERRALRGSQDAGDITGTPGICWEVKAGQAAIGASDGQIDVWITQLISAAIHARANYGVLVQRRRGKASPGDWWAWVWLGELMALTTDNDARFFGELAGLPCRLRLADLATILHRAGYGEAL